ncbi:unnamed protein product [Sphenostylis stenocarpa]|uniref:Uncharacterized protein n=1 Tax=Sphenostylis stenocarpa TaxID=92480 RepID=A0AA86SWX9_9FABA|nr:unnamed protein product [Sphenostylis stenocarpa]
MIWGRLKGVGMLVVPWCATGRGESGDSRGLLGGGTVVDYDCKGGGARVVRTMRWWRRRAESRADRARAWWRSRSDSRRLARGFDKGDGMGLVARLRPMVVNRAVDVAVVGTVKKKVGGGGVRDCQA